MLIKNEIEIGLGPRNIKHYKELGYNIPTSPVGKRILVKIDDLPNNSNEKINIECDNCKQQIKVVYRVYFKHNHNGKYYCNHCSSKVLMSGDKHWNWNSDRTEEDRQDRHNGNKAQINEWRKKVYDRDNYTCQHCHLSKSHHLIAHHLNGYDNYKEERFLVSNGITLCDECHKDFHHKYGYGNNTKKQFIQWNNC